MRIVIIILAVAGAVCSLLLGLKWASDYSEYKGTMDSATSALAQSVGAAAAVKAEVDAKAKEFENYGTASKMLMVAAGLALVGAVLVFKKQTLAAAAVLAVAGVLPVVFSAKTLMTTGFILAAAVLTLLTLLKLKPAAASGPPPAAH